MNGMKQAEFDTMFPGFGAVHVFVEEVGGALARVMVGIAGEDRVALDIPGASTPGWLRDECRQALREVGR